MKTKIEWVLAILFILYFCWLISPALKGQLTGVFVAHRIPQEYVLLAQYLQSSPQFSRTLWVPTTQRYGYFSVNHPMVDAYTFFATENQNDIYNSLQKTKTQTRLRDASIQFVIIPDDTNGEIFLTNRQYSIKLYTKAVSRVSHISYLHEVKGFGNIKVFQLYGAHNHFWSPSKNMNIRISVINPTDYVVRVFNAKKGDRVVFSEAYDPNWIIENSTTKQNLKNNIYDTLFNSFIVSNNGEHIYEVYYKPQRFVVTGLVISFITGVIIVTFLAFYVIKK